MQKHNHFIMMNTLNLEIICQKCQIEILDSSFYSSKTHQEIRIFKEGFISKLKFLI